MASRRDTSFLKAMKSLLVFDGAMGSLLYERGCLRHPELRAAQRHPAGHRAEDPRGLRATPARRCIETNTFGANRFRLDRHGLGDQVRAYNVAGARLAREAAGENGVGGGLDGALGPRARGRDASPSSRSCSRPSPSRRRRWSRAAPTLLVLETFRHLEEIRIALEAARKAAPELPIIASMAFDSERDRRRRFDARAGRHRVARLGRGRDRRELRRRAAARARHRRAACAGRGFPLCVQPNAGLPRTVDGRLLYMATPEYFDVFARRTIQLGATMIGGCCGTTPEHVRWMAKSGADARRPAHVDDRPPERGHDGRGGDRPRARRRSPSGARSRRRSRRGTVRGLGRGQPGARPRSRRRRSRARRCCSTAASTSSTSPTARARWPACRTSRSARCCIERYGIEPILHVCGRDRNLLGQMAHLLGAHAIGIRNLVIITGDPPKVGDYPEATAVYDLDAIGLLQMASNMNRGVDPAGKRLARRQDVVPARDRRRARRRRPRQGDPPPRAEEGRGRRARDDAAGLPDGPARRRCCGASSTWSCRCWSACCRS